MSKAEFLHFFNLSHCKFPFLCDRFIILCYAATWYTLPNPHCPFAMYRLPPPRALQCLAAGSFILHREQESEDMRDLARALCSHLDLVRALLKDQALRNPAAHTAEVSAASARCHMMGKGNKQAKAGADGSGTWVKVLFRVVYTAGLISTRVKLPVGFR